MRYVILDEAVNYGRECSRSLLCMPVGDRCVLDRVLAGGASLEPLQTLIVSQSLPRSQYRLELEAVVDGRADLVSPDEFSRINEEVESFDMWLFVHPRIWPQEGYGFDTLNPDLLEYRGVIHGIAAGQPMSGRAREQVECDGRNHVRRVRRFYDPVNWPRVAGRTIFYSLVPGRLPAKLRLKSLPELRTQLSAEGLLSQDRFHEQVALDLSHEPALLAFNEKAISDQVSRGGLPPSRNRAVERKCRIAESARLYEPVIVGDGAVIEDGALIVGPAVIGANCRIQQGARVLQAVVYPGTSVPAEATLRHRLSLPEDPAPAPSRHIAAEPMSGQEDESCDRRAARFDLKRIMDLVLATLGLVILSPFMLMVAVWVKLTSAGPVFFKHLRETCHHQQFYCYKFRTMMTGADGMQQRLRQKNEVDGPQFKITNDPRITPLGKWLRSTCIDELPQLFNVIRGDMSLVGPRPSPFRENQICVPWRKARLTVRPGITGLWQVCRRRDREEGDFHEWIYYDVHYVRHASIWLDIKILLATVLTLGGKIPVPIQWLIPARRLRQDWASRVTAA